MIGKPTRGVSSASKRASQYLAKNPAISASALADKFGISITTIRRASWWKSQARATTNGREIMEQNKDQSGAAVRGEAVAECETTNLIELLRSIRPNYGAVGSRDVDVTAMRKKIDAAITILSARAADALDSQPTEPVADVQARVRDAVAENLRGLYYCGRVWSAWSYGTMGEDDFSPAEEDDDIIANITDAVMATIAPASSQPTDGGVRNG